MSSVRLRRQAQRPRVYGVVVTVAVLLLAMSLAAMESPLRV